VLYCIVLCTVVLSFLACPFVDLCCMHTWPPCWGAMFHFEPCVMLGPYLYGPMLGPCAMYTWPHVEPCFGHVQPCAMLRPCLGHVGCIHIYSTCAFPHRVAFQTYPKGTRRELSERKHASLLASDLNKGVFGQTSLGRRPCPLPTAAAISRSRWLAPFSCRLQPCTLALKNESVALMLLPLLPSQPVLLSPSTRMMVRAFVLGLLLPLVRPLQVAQIS
jgi:hypothetical protein